MSEYGETSHRFPSFLPGREHISCTRPPFGTCCPSGQAGADQDWRSGLNGNGNADERRIVRGLRRGHLLFADPSSGTLMAQAIRRGPTASFSVSPLPVADGLASEGSRYASFSVSSNGLLVYGAAHGVSSRA
jgi:hypothetical protein